MANLYAVVMENSRGRWSWQAYDQGLRHRMGSTIWGFVTKAEAEADAKELLGKRHSIQVVDSLVKGK